MLRRARYVLVLAAWLGGAPCHAATNTVLLATGSVAPDGRVLSHFGSPAAGTGTKVSFVGRTSALMLQASGAPLTLFKSGDPLPPGLTGTWNEFLSPAVSDSGAIVFRATLNSNDATSGVFLREPDGDVIPIILTGGTLGGTVDVVRPPDVNAANDVVYMDGDAAIWVWDAETQTSSLRLAAGAAAPVGGTFVAFGERAVLNDAGVVAFMGRVGNDGGIFTVDPALVVTTVAFEGDPAPVGTVWASFGLRTPVSINPAGQVAFQGKTGGGVGDGVFRWDPTGPTTVPIALDDQFLDGVDFQVDDEWVGIAPSGLVGFQAKMNVLPTSLDHRLAGGDGTTLLGLTPFMKRGRGFPPRLPVSGKIAFESPGQTLTRVEGGSLVQVVGPADPTPIGLGISPREPSVDGGGTVAFRAMQGVLYDFDGTTPVSIATPGTAGPPGVVYRQVVSMVRRGALTLFRAIDANDPGGGSALVLRKGTGTPKLVMHDGEPSPVPGSTLEVTDAFDVATNGKVCFAAFLNGSGFGPLGGVFRATPSGIVSTVVLEGDPTPDGDALGGFDLVRWFSSKEVLLVSRLDSGDRGMYVAGPSGLVTIVRDGDPVPPPAGGAFTLFEFDPLAVSTQGKRVLFRSLLEGGAADSGAFVWKNGALATLALQGDVAPGTGGGSIDTFEFEESTAQGKSSSTFHARVSGGTVDEGLFRFVKGPLASLVTPGASLLPAGTLAAFEPGEPASDGKGRIVYDARASGIGAYGVLVSTKP